ncbi:MAG: GNAT family N-acetyltransferase [Nanoarchaeota archaeon]
MNIYIKKASKNDLKKLAEIYVEEFSKAPYNEPWTQEKALNKLKRFSKYCEIWNINYENQLVGFIVINPDQWYPGERIFGEDMAIKSNMQNKGIGTKVFELIFKEYKKRGFKIFMSIQNKNSKAKNLYNRLGILESKTNTLIEKELK